MQVIYALYINIMSTARMSLYKKKLNSSMCLIKKNKGKNINIWQKNKHRTTNSLIACFQKTNSLAKFCFWILYSKATAILYTTRDAFRGYIPLIASFESTFYTLLRGWHSWMPSGQEGIKCGSKSRNCTRRNLLCHPQRHMIYILQLSADDLGTRSSSDMTVS